MKLVKAFAFTGRLAAGMANAATPVYPTLLKDLIAATVPKIVCKLV